MPIASWASAASNDPKVMCIAGREMFGWPLASTDSACCNPAPTTATGQPCTPSCSNASAPIPASSTFCTSSTITKAPFVLHSRSSCVVARRVPRSRPSRAGDSTTREPPRPETPVFIVLAVQRKPATVSALPRLMPMPVIIRTNKAAGSRKPPVCTFKTTTPLPAALAVNSFKSAVLPTPCTPSTSAIPACASAGASTTDCTCASNAASSSCRPAKWGGWERSVLSRMAAIGSGDTSNHLTPREGPASGP